MSDDLDPSLESPALAGTTRLARAVLASPHPRSEAESDSRRQVESLMQATARDRREPFAFHPGRPWWQRLQFWKK